MTPQEIAREVRFSSNFIMAPTPYELGRICAEDNDGCIPEQYFNTGSKSATAFIRGYASVDWLGALAPAVTEQVDIARHFPESWIEFESQVREAGLSWLLHDIDALDWLWDSTLVEEWPVEEQQALVAVGQYA